MIIAQISDTHLTVDDGDSAQRIEDFERVIAHINAADPLPDVIVHTGDVVHNGRPEEYAEAARILAAARAPVHVIPGNKDDRAALRAAFSAGGCFSPLSPFLDYAVEDFPVRLLMLDTLNPGSNRGDFCAERAERLAALAASRDDRPLALFAHHPPFEVDVGPDPVHFDDPAAMARMRDAIRGIGNVAALFCGHVHRFASGSIGDIPARVVTAVATGLRKGDYPEAAQGRPLYYCHGIDAGGGLTSQMRIAR